MWSHAIRAPIFEHSPNYFQFKFKIPTETIVNLKGRTSSLINE